MLSLHFNSFYTASKISKCSKMLSYKRIFFIVSHEVCVTFNHVHYTKWMFFFISAFMGQCRILLFRTDFMFAIFLQKFFSPTFCSLYPEKFFVFFCWEGFSVGFIHCQYTFDQKKLICLNVSKCSPQTNIASQVSRSADRGLY
jgi:hypothetical protein